MFCCIEKDVYLCIANKQKQDIMKKNDFIECERDGYGFRYYFNAGFNEETCQCDEEGLSVFSKDDRGKFHFIADVPTCYDVSDIMEMSDEEFGNFLSNNDIC